MLRVCFLGIQKNSNVKGCLISINAADTPCRQTCRITAYTEV